MEKEVIDNSIVNEKPKKRITKQDIIKENEKLKDELNKLKNDYLYLLADMDNQKKRNIEKINNLTKYKNEDLLLDILDIVDDLEREIKITKESNPLYNKLINILHRYDVKAIYDIDHKEFNEKYDNAITSINIDNKDEDNKIVDILRRGYLYKDKILRYEDVVIGKYEEKNN